MNDLEKQWAKEKDQALEKFLSIPPYLYQELNAHLDKLMLGGEYQLIPKSIINEVDNTPEGDGIFVVSSSDYYHEQRRNGKGYTRYDTPCDRVLGAPEQETHVWKLKSGKYFVSHTINWVSDEPVNVSSTPLTLMKKAFRLLENQ